MTDEERGSSLIPPGTREAGERLAEEAVVAGAAVGGAPDGGYAPSPNRLAPPRWLSVEAKRRMTRRPSSARLPSRSTCPEICFIISRKLSNLLDSRSNFFRSSNDDAISCWIFDGCHFGAKTNEHSKRSPICQKKIRDRFMALDTNCQVPDEGPNGDWNRIEFKMNRIEI